MKTRQIITLVSSIAIIAVLGYYVNETLKTEGKSDPTELINFEVEDVEQVNKVVIYDPMFDKSFTIVKENDEWVDADGTVCKTTPLIIS